MGMRAMLKPIATWARPRRDRLRRTSICPGCGQQVALTRGGGLWPHMIGVGRGSETCTERAGSAAEEAWLRGVVPPIWESGVLAEPTEGLVGHRCVGEGRRDGRGQGYHRLEREGMEKRVPWEKCGECPGLLELTVRGIRIEDVPASELDLRQWPAQSAGMRWLFQSEPRSPRPRRPWVPSWPVEVRAVESPAVAG